MKVAQRALVSRHARINPDCPETVYTLPPSAIVVPVTEVLILTLASFVWFDVRSPNGSDREKTYADQIRGSFLGLSATQTENEISALFYDLDTLRRAAVEGRGESASRQMLYPLNERASAILREIAQLSDIQPPPPVYLAPVGDVEQLFSLVSKRADRDAMRLGWPEAIAELIVRGPAESWGVAVLLPQEYLFTPQRKDSAESFAAFNVDKFMSVLNGGRLMANAALVKKLATLSTRFVPMAPKAAVDKYNKVSNAAAAEYYDPDARKQLETEAAQLKREIDAQNALNAQWRATVVSQCAYRIRTLRSGYASYSLILAGLKKALPPSLFNRFADNVVSTVLFSNLTRKVERADATVKIREERRKYGLYQPQNLEPYIDAVVQEGRLGSDAADDLKDRWRDLQQFLDLRTVERVMGGDDDAAKYAKNQLYRALGRRESTYVAPYFVSTQQDARFLQSEVLAVVYCQDWGSVAKDAGRILNALVLASPTYFSGSTFADVGAQVEHYLAYQSNAAAAVSAFSSKYASWVADHSIAPLVIYAAAWTSDASKWPALSDGEIKKAASLPSVSRDGSLLLFKAINSVKGETRVEPALLSARDIAAVFSNFVAAPVHEVGLRQFVFDAAKADPPALRLDTLATNRGVMGSASRMAEEESIKEEKKVQKAAEKAARAKSNGKGPKEPPIPKGDVLHEAINAYLVRIAPAGDVFSRIPEEVKHAQIGADLTGAARVSGELRPQGWSAAAGVKPRFNQVVAVFKRSAQGWWPNLSRVLSDNVAVPTKGIGVEKQNVNQALLLRALDLYGLRLAYERAMEDKNRVEVRYILQELRAHILHDSPPEAEGRVESYDLEMYRPALRDIRENSRGVVDPTYGAEEQIIARMNPRTTQRAPRAARAPRRTHRARKNPLSPDYSERLRAAFTQQTEFPDQPTDVPVDYTHASRAFPDYYDALNAAKPELAAERIAAHGSFVRHGRRPMLDNFTLDQPIPAEQSGLSLEEARSIFNRQADALRRRRNSTVPASSALCAVNRVQRLRGYMLPDALLRFGPPGFADKKIVIWVSPENVARSRVMMIRRNVHIDCDFAATVGGQTLGQIVALAIQDALMWLGQREVRMRDTYVYLGRVGHAQLQPLWQPGDALTLDAVSARRNSPAVTIPAYDAARDVAAYLNASKLTVAMPSSSPSPRAPVYEPPLEDSNPPETKPTARSTRRDVPRQPPTVPVSPPMASTPVPAATTGTPAPATTTDIVEIDLPPGFISGDEDLIERG